MPFTRTRFIRLLRIGVLVLVSALIVGYAIWRSFAYAEGPSIVIAIPADGATVPLPTIKIQGTASRINSLKINGNSISVDEKGNFKDVRAIFPGINMITISATDQFGRSTRKEIEVIGKRPEEMP